jgi:hypothetical protein
VEAEERLRHRIRTHQPELIPLLSPQLRTEFRTKRH